jgi:prepilin-type processing-associated H-X9-DG protein
MSGELPIPSDETLLGYILGGLCEQENAQIELLLAHSESLRLRLRDLRSMLEPLAQEPACSSDQLESQFDPPTRLIDSTMAAIIEQSQQTLDASQCQSESNAPISQHAEASEVVSLYIASEHHAAQTPSNRIVWFDSLATILAGIVILSLFLPGIFRWRESARRHECAENLRNLGSALGSFAMFQPTHRLPAIELSGPLAFAGVYSIRLQDNSLLESQGWLQCPNDSSSSLLANIPTSQQFLQAPESKRFVWRMLAGGDYAYHMGSIVDGLYQTPSIESPARIAWIGDTYPLDLDAESVDKDFEHHGSRALNVLFSDGSVQWLKLPKLPEMASIDHPYLNRAFKQAAGIGPSDACLGPSPLLPTIGSD